MRRAVAVRPPARRPPWLRSEVRSCASGACPAALGCEAPAIVLADQAPLPCLADRLLDHFGAGVRRDALGGRLSRSGHGHDFDPGPRRSGHVVVVQDEACRNAQASGPPDGWDRQVDLGWEHVGHVVQEQAGFVREHPGALRPQPERDQLLVVAGRKLREPVAAAVDAADPAGAKVLLQVLRRVAAGFGLRQGEQAGLGFSRRIEALPCRGRRRQTARTRGWHRTKRNQECRTVHGSQACPGEASDGAHGGRGSPPHSRGSAHGGPAASLHARRELTPRRSRHQVEVAAEDPLPATGAPAAHTIADLG